MIQESNIVLCVTIYIIHVQIVAENVATFCILKLLKVMKQVKI
jgi:hypothetical protein